MAMARIWGRSTVSTGIKCLAVSTMTPLHAWRGASWHEMREERRREEENRGKREEDRGKREEGRETTKEDEGVVRERGGIEMVRASPPAYITGSNNDNKYTHTHTHNLTIKHPCAPPWANHYIRGHTLHTCITTGIRAIARRGPLTT